MEGMQVIYSIKDIRKTKSHHQVQVHKFKPYFHTSILNLSRNFLHSQRIKVARFTIVWVILGSNVWKSEAVGLTTPTLRCAAGDVTNACPIAAAGGLIAVENK